VISDTVIQRLTERVERYAERVCTAESVGNLPNPETDERLQAALRTLMLARSARDPRLARSYGALATAGGSLLPQEVRVLISLVSQLVGHLKGRS